MASIQFGADGEIVSESYDGETTTYEQGAGVTTSAGSIGDPNAPQYTDEALAAALEFTQGFGSPEQASLDKAMADEKFAREKADEVASRKADGTPIYVRSESERASLLAKANGIRNGLPLSLIMANRAIAARYLDQQAEAANLRQTASDHTALEARAQAIVFERQANELADLMAKRGVSGNRR
jgi:hypothetical protein